MMTFYSAVGCYRIRKENGRNVPYIQKLGKLYPLSIPEFVIWSTLLWEVLTYNELEKFYQAQIRALAVKTPPLDELLELLIRRKLVVKGVGYTGCTVQYALGRLCCSFSAGCQQKIMESFETDDPGEGIFLSGMCTAHAEASL